jgi:hypothetical protein
MAVMKKSRLWRSKKADGNYAELLAAMYSYSMIIY